MLAVLNVAATHRDPELARQAWRLLVRTTSLPPARWRNNPPVGRVQVCLATFLRGRSLMQRTSSKAQQLVHLKLNGQLSCSSCIQSERRVYLHTRWHVHPIQRA